jgi:spermidine synthase
MWNSGKLEICRRRKSRKHGIVVLRASALSRFRDPVCLSILKHSLAVPHDLASHCGPRMKPHLKLAETLTPDGARLSLHSHDGNFCIRVNGQELMHSAAASSEQQLGELATEAITTRPARILIGGLGLGFTLKSVLEKSGPDVAVDVAELFPAVVEWNRTFLAGLNGALLADPRVKVLVGDVGQVLSRAAAVPYDAILLDIDNGPTAMVQANNSGHYRAQGIQRIATALKPGGRAAIWSAKTDHAFETRLKKAGFTVKAVPAKLYATAKRSTYTIYLADKTDP